MERFTTILAGFEFVAAIACTPTSPSDGTGAEAPADCVPESGVYHCLGATLPVCPTSAQPEQPCDGKDQACMGCSATPVGSVGAGFTCQCADAGLVPAQDGGLWDCIGTEHTCL
jgi:hypothetical protein